ncbi:SDR family oxidoreductase [Desmonostoc muscorum LEGE 12446]|uniref:SDR family oxidoreductase n=1 Tax=Desmonostoc muscorum LEGE 12446 TaxID=1828758 RepID=A0A8J7DI38_DESMC|nr:SDR family oxidoreductase [Desmonostoc muscorum]MCF2151219.1 SDR family oxidoreductase [Desmonostoc muscorum LEGE 12446]
MRHVFLTGATGFLRAFLLDELLHQTQAKIYCLVCSTNEHEGLKKIQQNLKKYSLHHPNFSSHVIAIPGDLEQPYLGLPNTLNGLADSAIVCPPMDVKLLDKYLSYFVSSGFLNSPPLRQE